MMASVGTSYSPQYLVFQLLPGSLSNRQRDKRVQIFFLVADLRSALVLIAELQKTVTDLKLHGIDTATSLRVLTPSTIKFMPGPFPHTPVSLCMAADAEVCELALASAVAHPCCPRCQLLYRSCARAALSGQVA